MGGADRDFREDIAVANKAAVPGLGDDIAGVDVDIGAQRLQAFEEQIDRARADGATARQRHFRFAHAGQQRADHPERGAHLRHQLVRRRRVDDVSGGEIDGARIALILLLATAIDRIIDAVIAQDADQLLDIGQMRHVFQRQRVVGQKRGDHQGQRRVFRTRDRNASGELVAPDNSDAIHGRTSLSAEKGRFNRLSSGPSRPLAGLVQEIGFRPARAKSGRFELIFLYFLRCSEPVRPLIGFSGAARARLRLALLQIGTQLLGQPILAVGAALFRWTILFQWNCLVVHRPVPAGDQPARRRSGIANIVAPPCH